MQVESRNTMQNSSPVDPIRQRAFRACQRVTRQTLHSHVVDLKLVGAVPRFECEEILLGDLLGTGEFCHVVQVNRINLTLANPKADVSVSNDARRRMKMSAESKNDKFAIKFLRNDLSADKFCQGATELVVEMHLLSSLSHSNLIKLRGVSKDGTLGFQKGSGYFIIIERLRVSLDKQIRTWKVLDRSSQLDADSRLSLFAERLGVAAGIASALTYLHSKNIVYRGIDPTNFAFDDSGRIVLFDMGLARELDESKLSSDGINYDLSGNKGNIQYMAPEVALCQPYGLPSDVYGVAVLLWQLCTLASSPFPGVTRREQYLERIVRLKERPKLDSSWAETLQYLFQCSWAHEPSSRPPMNLLYRNLVHEIDDIQGMLKVSAHCNISHGKHDLSASASMSARGVALHHSPTSPKEALQVRTRPSITNLDPRNAVDFLKQSPSKGDGQFRNPRTMTPTENPHSPFDGNRSNAALSSKLSPSESCRNTLNCIAQANSILQVKVPSDKSIDVQQHELEQKLQVVNAAFSIMGSTESARRTSPTSIPCEEKKGSSLKHHTPMLQNVSAEQSRPEVHTNLARHESPFAFESNPVLREYREKKWKLALADMEAKTITALPSNFDPSSQLQMRNIKGESTSLNPSDTIGQTQYHPFPKSLDSSQVTNKCTNPLLVSRGKSLKAVHETLAKQPVRSKSLTASNASYSRVPFK